MNKFFYYNSLCLGSNTQSVFSIDPYVTAIKELLVSELKQVVYYIEKLRDLDFDMNSYTDKVIEFITILIVNLDFTKENTFIIIEDLYNNKKMLEKMYISASEKLGIETELFPENSKNLSSKDIILKALNEKEKDIKTNNEKIEKNRKYLYEIMMNIVLNTCNKLIEIKSYGITCENAKNQVLKFLNTTNIPSLSDKELIEIIKNFAQTSFETTKTLYNTLMNKFGPISKTKVDVIEKEGKAILISGSSFNELEKILNAVKGLNINVYSYNEMISAFQYEKFKNHPNFIGHYSKSTNNIQSDFASFPGPVFVTRNSMPKIDVIRGRIFTSMKYPAFGISKIENDNFEPLISSALESDGFQNDIKYKTLNIGYNLSEIENGIEEIRRKFQNKDIRNIIIIGLADKFNYSDEYLSEFLELDNEKNYIISFAYEKDKLNVLNVNTFFDFGIVYEIVEQLIKKENEIKKYITIFLADCNNTTISHIFNLMHLGVENIFLGACCPNVVSPLLVDGLSKMFNIKLMTNPVNDLKLINEE